MSSTRTSLITARCRNYAVLGILILLAVPLLFAQDVAPSVNSQPVRTWTVHWQPVQLVNGDPVFLQVGAPSHLKSLDGTWLGHQVTFAYDQKTNTWYGIAGVGLDVPAGVYTLSLAGRTASGEEVIFRQTIPVHSAKYRSISVNVPAKFTEPSPEQVEKINQDKAIKKEFFSRITPERKWSGSFRPPVQANVSDVFGTRRVFNGKALSTHQGLDYAVREGTPVSALNSGTVLLARPMYFEGNCVVLDHGQGLLSLYMHLSKIDVKDGEHVTSGQVIGLSGGTGRATGPHLHVGVRWQGIYLNPETLLGLHLPEF